MTGAPRGRIRRLPEALVNKIAAGEVVERPASVVKELVENSLDAAARSVTVELRDGGAALIRVSDDGDGMSADELRMALERHATSKLAEDADLESIATLGFRGEALPAICAVSRFSLTSRARESGEGTRLAGVGGVVSQDLTVPAPAGTTVEVADLFFNTPARLKFLKAPGTELAAALRAVAQLAVAHPEVQFRVTSQGRPVLTAPEAHDRRDRLGALWGYELAGRLLDVERREHGVAIEGLASPPDLTRGGRDDVVLVVNGRPVRDPALFQAVLQAYRPLLPRDRFPVAALSLALPLADVDVNVHPTKAWVRFRHPRLVHELIAAALAEALRRGQGRLAAPGPAPGAPGAGPAPGLTGATGEQAQLFGETRATYGSGAFGRVLGQVQDTFIVATSEREVFFIDQHAAHERVVFDRMQDEVAGGAVPSQALLFPEPVRLGPGGPAVLRRWRAPLERLGFALEEFGGDAVVLRAVPVVLRHDEPGRLLEALVDDLGGTRAADAVIDRTLALVACRAAIKANQPLEREAMERLVADLAGTRTPHFCPHGRPTLSRVSLLDVRREVRRSW